MNSRERVRAVLERRIPDRVPNGLGGCETAGMHVVTYDRLQNVLGCEKRLPRVDTFMVNAVFEEPVINAMEGDVILLDSPRMCSNRIRSNEQEKWKNQKLWGKTFSVPINEIFTEREDGSIYWENRDIICPKGGYYFDLIETTDLAAKCIVPDPDEYNPSPELPEQLLRSMEEQAKRIYEETGLSMWLGESIQDLQVLPGGMINTMILMIEHPDVMQALLEKSVDVALKNIIQLEQAVGKYVDVMSIAQDFGDNNGVTIGADLWREIYKKPYKRLFQGWKKVSGMKINMHSCGSIYSILEDLIECGVDIINPLQTSAKDMSAEHIKSSFGDRVILYGGAYDAQMFHADMDYDEVYRTVYENIKIFAKGGGYIFAGVHNLPAEMPEHHIKAMLDAYYDARDYI